ncbi:MAG: purine-nucleoside phosphorylase [Methylobacteriaceae bacterium]|jgi:purine-nucleoside phosphorylase|nr:purine-nucleoside phosphorylase [Methylobacteriaceae bacterium]
MTTQAEAAVEVLRSRGIVEPVELAIGLGPQLGSLAENLENAIGIPYPDLPGFPAMEKSVGEGRLLVGTLEGTRIACLQGRSHFYETGDPTLMATPLETLAMLGVSNLLIAAIAGSVNADFYPGHLVLINDHINFTGLNPLIGLASEGGFVSLTEAYDKRLLRRLKQAAAGAGVTVHEGIYMWFSGPSFETPAEVKVARLLGADVIGMSVVPEIILARRLAMRVAAIAVITSFGAGFSGGNPTHAETRQQALSGLISLRRLIRGFLKIKEEDWGVRLRRDDTG